MKPEIEHLVAACQRKEADALKQLYDEFSPMMLGVCMRYTRSRDEAQDLLHDGFLKVYKNIGKLKQPMALEDWIYRIMVNVCVNYVCRRREVVYCGITGMDGRQNEEQFSAAPFDTDPFETAEVMKAIRALPDPYRAVFNMKESEFEFRQGPVFADIVLVDEINRAPAKTQAALFEVMEERQATIDGVSYAMGDLFTVMATQNPVEQEGTYKLPEAQLDRFLMKIVMSYPSPELEVEILRRHHENARLTKLEDVAPVLTREELLQYRSLLSNVVVEESLLKYIVDVVQLTRTAKAVYLGASPRAAVALLKASKAFALLNARDFVTPEDIKQVAPSVLQHRIILTAEAEMEGQSPTRLVQSLIDQVEVPQ